MFGISGADNRQIIGMTVTANLGLEACVYDKTTGQIEKYSRRPLEYNIASKEIQDMGMYRNVVSELLQDIGISKEAADIYMVLPNVHFGFRSIQDPTVMDDEIESMILQDASESYIFKQEDPIANWTDINARKNTPEKYIAHSSFQRRVVDSIQDAIMDIGANIVGIETSTTAIPRGIALTGFVDELINTEENWNILLINPNGYAITQMSGNRILGYEEVPFAIMSYEGDEIYGALASAVKAKMPKFPFKKLIIVSLTDNVSAEQLKRYMFTGDEIIAVDSNVNGKKVIMPISQAVDPMLAQSMTMAVLGACVPKFAKMATLNYISDISYDGVIEYGTIPFGAGTLDITSVFVRRFCITATGIFLFLLILLGGAAFGMKSYFESQKSPISANVKKLDTEITELKSKLENGIDDVIKQIIADNKLAMNYYDSLSSDIPKDLWLTYYINEDGRNVGIEGYATDINDIYAYYRSLRNLAPQGNIKLNKLEVFKDEEEGAGNNGDTSVLDTLTVDMDEQIRLFTFEISNMTYQKSFDKDGNKVEGENGGQTGGDKVNNAPAAPVNSSSPSLQGPSSSPSPQGPSSAPPRGSSGTSVPQVEDVEVNLKEIK